MVRRFAPRDEIGATNKEGEELSHHGSSDSSYCIGKVVISQMLDGPMTTGAICLGFVLQFTSSMLQW